MAYEGKNPFKVLRALMLVGGVRSATLTGAETLNLLSSQLQSLDPGGASRTLTLPAEELNEGLWYEVYNTADADEDITLNNDASSAIAVIHRGGFARVACTGTAWGVVAASESGAGTMIDLNGLADALILDADADTTISAPTDDQIDFELNGADDFTMTANAFNVLSGSNVTLADSCEIRIGTGNDDQITHNGTDTLWTHVTGDLVIDNTDVNDQIILRVGTDTTATGIEFRNNSDAAMWNMRPTSATAGSLKGADASALVLGDGDDIAIAWDATKLAITQAATNSAIHLGISGAGIDLNLFGDTAGRDMTWDQSADSLIFGDSAKVVFGTGSDVTFLWDGTDLLVSQALADSIVKWGVSGAGINHVFYGDTATYDMTWDQTNDQLLFNDNAKVAVGTGAGGVGDIAISWDGTRCNVAALTADSEIRWGVDGAGIDQRFYGDTASAAMLWDQSLDALVFSGVASVRGLRTSSATAAAITGVTVLALADAGGVFSVSQAAAYDIDLPSPTSGPGCRYVFYLTAAGANNVTITVNGAAATFVGTIINDVTSVVPATGSTLTFASSTAALGDTIEIISISTTLYLVKAVSSVNGGITIA